MSDETFRRMAAQTTQELTTALAEAQAEIARLEDQVGDWIVRADEANVRADRLEAALRSIADATDLHEPCGWAVHRARAALETNKKEGAG